MTWTYQVLVVFATIAVSVQNTCDFSTCTKVHRMLAFLENHSCHGNQEVETESSYLVGGTRLTRLGEVARHVTDRFPKLPFGTLQTCLTGNYSWDYLCTPDQTTCGSRDSYRTYDGKCNNPDHPEWGGVGTEQLRLLAPEFDDGFSSLRSHGKGGEALPNPRAISNVLLHDIEPDEDPKFTMWVWAFGQLLDHDLVLTPMMKDKNGKKISCCGGQHECGSVCAPIPIPEDDPHFSKTGQTCMNFVRSVSSPCCSPNCTRTPINRISAHIDANPTYGNTDQEAADFRVDGSGPNTKGAKLKVSSDFKLEGYNLPRNADQTKCEDGSPTVPFCTLSGDARHHVAPSMISSVTMFHREHNRIVDKLRELNNPGWDEERLYQEARKIVMAEYQKLTMDDLIPEILDDEIIHQYNLGWVDGYHNTYDKTINAQITVSFSTAAYRFGHSLINAHQGQRNKANTHTILEDVAHQTFNKANMTQYLDGVSGILRYLGHKGMGKPDNHFSPEVRDLMFLTQHHTSLDLSSVNIMRGRDHGLAPYLAWRRYFHLPEFPESHDSDKADQILQVYDNKPENIDLYVGALTEPNRAGALVGDTFAHMLAEQFWRLKAGDRYYFQNRPDQETTVGRFTSEAQVKSIQTMTLARIICANTETDRIQPNVFVKAGPGNMMVPCDDYLSIPDIDFSLWREY